MRGSTMRFLAFAVLALALGAGAYFMNANSLYAGASKDNTAITADQAKACCAEEKTQKTAATAAAACEYKTQKTAAAASACTEEKAQNTAQTASACTEEKTQKTAATAAAYGVKTSATSCSEVHESVRTSASASACPVTGARATQTAAADCDMKTAADCDMKTAADCVKATGTDCSAPEKALKADGKTGTKAALASLDAESSK